MRWTLGGGSSEMRTWAPGLPDRRYGHRGCQQKDMRDARESSRKRKKRSLEIWRIREVSGAVSPFPVPSLASRRFSPVPLPPSSSGQVPTPCPRLAVWPAGELPSVGSLGPHLLVALAAGHGAPQDGGGGVLLSPLRSTLGLWAGDAWG